MHSRLNTHQKSVLEAAFSQSEFLNHTTLKQLAQQTGINITKIRDWFAYKRKTIRRKKKKGILSKGDGTERNR